MNNRKLSLIAETIDIKGFKGDFMMKKCYNNTYNKALRDSNLKGLLINNSLLGVIMTASNNTRNIERGQSRNQKPMYGIGYDSKGKYQKHFNSKETEAYKKWRGMLKRCYCAKYHSGHPTYIGCVVADEWRDFQNFAEWFYNQPYSELSYHLDKDLLTPNNKIYSPDVCCLVPSALNNLLLTRRAVRGAYPQGVSLDKSNGRYKSELMIDGKKKYLGRYHCPNKAHQAYKIAKEHYVKNKAIEWQDRIADNVFQALMKWTLDS